uniref:HAT C-terminal dimerisation domain-containing protein n=1 Tax=Ixodes ricinus TaxID=34613 RepID=A0A6B0UUG9_IXORI
MGRKRKALDDCATDFIDESSFRFRVQIVNPCIKVELPEGFVPYESIYRLVLRDERKLSDLDSEFLCYRQYAVTSTVDPVLFWKLHLPDWPLLSQASLDILGFPVSSANVERAFSKLRVVNRKERAAMTDASLSKYACIYYNNQV